MHHRGHASTTGITAVIESEVCSAQYNWLPSFPEQLMDASLQCVSGLTTRLPSGDRRPWKSSSLGSAQAATDVTALVQQCVDASDGLDFPLYTKIGVLAVM